MVLCDSAGPGAAFMSVSFVSLLSGEQVARVDILPFLLRRLAIAMPNCQHFGRVCIYNFLSPVYSILLF